MILRKWKRNESDKTSIFEVPTFQVKELFIAYGGKEIGVKSVSGQRVWMIEVDDSNNELILSKLRELKENGFLND